MPPWERYQTDATPEATGPWARYQAQPEQAPAPATEERPGALGFLNQGIAQGLGAPVDLVGAIMGIEEPFGGSGTISRGMDWIGADVAPADVRPESVGENIMSGAGGAAGALLPFTGLARAVSGSAGLAGQVGSRIMDAFTRTPATAVASELAAGGAAGAGAEIASRAAPDSEISPLVGAVAGGLAGGMGPYVLSQVSPVTWGVRALQHQFAPFTKTGATSRASERVQSLVPDPEEAAQAVTQDSLGGLSPAARSGDSRLMALEQEVRRTDPIADRSMGAAEEASSQRLREAIMGLSEGGAPTDARGFAEQVVRREVDNLQPYLDQTLGQPAGVARTSRGIREGSQPTRSAAYQEAYDTPIDYSSEAGWQVEELLGRVERAAPGTIARANRMMAAEGETSAQIMADIAEDGTVTYFRMPDTRQVDYITRALNDMAYGSEGSGAMGGMTDMGTMMRGLSRQIRDATRAANPNYGAALEAGATPIGQRNALQLGAKLLSPSTPRDEALMEIQNMTPGEVQFVRQGVRSQLDETLANVRTSLSTPNTGMAQAQRALRDLSAPAVREKIGLILPEEEAASFFQRIDETAGLLDPRRSGPAVVAGARPNEEIRALLNSPDPGAATRQLLEQARAAAPEGAASVGQTGAVADSPAVKGLRAALLDDLLNKARTGQFYDEGSPVLSGRSMRGALSQDPKVQAVANELLTPEQRTFLDTAVDELSKLEMMRSGRLPDVGAVMEGTPNTLLEYAVGVLAARTGAQAGAGTSGASLKTASMATRKADQAVRSLTLDRAEGMIREAFVENPELAAALLAPPSRITDRQAGLIEQAISRGGDAAIRTGVGTAGGAAATIGDDEAAPDDDLNDTIMRQQ